MTGGVFQDQRGFQGLQQQFVPFVWVLSNHRTTTPNTPPSLPRLRPLQLGDLPLLSALPLPSLTFRQATNYSSSSVNHNSSTTTSPDK